jgi:hypothetical protein
MMVASVLFVAHATVARRLVAVAIAMGAVVNNERGGVMVAANTPLPANKP